MSVYKGSLDFEELSAEEKTTCSLSEKCIIGEPRFKNGEGKQSARSIWRSGIKRNLTFHVYRSPDCILPVLPRTGYSTQPTLTIVEPFIWNTYRRIRRLQHRWCGPREECKDIVYLLIRLRERNIMQPCDANESAGQQRTTGINDGAIKLSRRPRTRVPTSPRSIPDTP